MVVSMPATCLNLQTAFAEPTKPEPKSENVTPPAIDALLGVTLESLRQVLLPPQTPHWSTIFRLLGTKSHPIHVWLLPEHTPQASMVALKKDDDALGTHKAQVSNTADPKQLPAQSLAETSDRGSLHTPQLSSTNVPPQLPRQSMAMFQARPVVPSTQLPQSSRRALPLQKPAQSIAPLAARPVLPLTHIPHASIIAAPKQSPLQSLEAPLPAHTPQLSVRRPEKGTLLHPAHEAPSPPQTPQLSSTTPTAQVATLAF